MGIINMNGRIYDPLIGRFMSADPYIQAPSDLQSFNRYGYVRNNPLNKTDPSGYSWWTKFRDKILLPVIAGVLDYFGCSGYCTMALNAYNAGRTRLPDGSRCGPKCAGVSIVVTIVTWNLPVDSSEITQAGVRIVGACAASAAAQGSCRDGAYDAATNEVAGGIFGAGAGGAIAGCANASRAGRSCGVGARDGLTDYVSGQVVSAGVNYLTNRGGSGGSNGSGGSSSGGGGGDDESVLLAQASQAGRLGMGNQAGNAGNFYDNGQPVDGGCGYCRSPRVDIPRMPEISFDIRSLIPLPIRIGWEWMMSVSGVDQPREPDLVIVPEKDGNKIAQESGWNNAHEAKKGRGESRVNIYDDKKTGRKWLWNGKKGSGKEEL